MKPYFAPALRRPPYSICLTSAPPYQTAGRREYQTMTMIAEATIERVLNRLEGGADEYAQELQDFAHSQPALMTYLTDEDNEAFTDIERELLLFGALVVYQSVTDQRTEPTGIEPAAISKAEEANYALIGTAKGTFRDRITPFFEQSPEEELLAFIEDLLIADEEDGITKEAREPLFITLKTLVDVLIV
ncbi:MAG: hypothetical protein AAGF89_07650 [Bacteroidota bacterium]